MTTHDRALEGRRLLGRRSHRDTVRGADRGLVDESDVLWPVGASFSLDGATDWLNSSPLAGADLRGHVVIINFCTYTCINWLRQLPYVRAWSQEYRSHGLVVIGVHSPEFSFEHDVELVRDAVESRSIDYPVAIDNNFSVWRSFNNHYWPALYLVDAGGRLRHHTFGEGGYEETEAVLRTLLAEAGTGPLPPRREQREAAGIELAADWGSLRSAETYLGSDRTSGFSASPGLEPGRPRIYSRPERLRLGHWALAGHWTAEREFALSHDPGGVLTCRFQARDLHLVAGRSGRGSSPVRFKVSLDGREPAADHGVDIDAYGHGTINEPRLYQLIRHDGAVGSRTVDIEFLDPGVAVYAFTFG